LSEQVEKMPNYQYVLFTSNPYLHGIYLGDSHLIGATTLALHYEGKTVVVIPTDSPWELVSRELVEFEDYKLPVTTEDLEQARQRPNVPGQYL
jgi:hypothetical protein